MPDLLVSISKKALPKSSLSNSNETSSNNRFASECSIPGLILEIHNKNKTIEINATNIEMKKMEILKMRDAVNINLKDRAEFLLLRERYIKYPFDSNYSKEIVDRKLEQLRKINVFLD